VKIAIPAESGTGFVNSYKALFIAIGIIAGLFGGAVFLYYFPEWSSRRDHAQEIERAFNERLLPAAAFVRGFVEREHRLPSDEEMKSAGWLITSMDTMDATDGIFLWRERPNWMGTWGVTGKDFMVETQVPDWNLYYQSWDNKRIEANWP
jgi:hypothetical protein